MTIQTAYLFIAVILDNRWNVSVVELAKPSIRIIGERNLSF